MIRRKAMQNREQLFINGEWVSPVGSQFMDVINAATEEVLGRIPAGTGDDAAQAVTAARNAFEGWSATSPVERAAYLRRIKAGLVARSEELARTITAEVGM